MVEINKELFYSSLPKTIFMQIVILSKTKWQPPVFKSVCGHVSTVTRSHGTDLQKYQPYFEENICGITSEHTIML